MSRGAPETLDDSIVGGHRHRNLAEAVREAEQILAAELTAERELCEGSLIEFMIRAWPEVEPGELDVNWHHREIADYNLDAFLGRAITAARRAPGRVFRIPGFWDSPNLEHIPLRSSRIRHG